MNINEIKKNYSLSGMPCHKYAIRHLHSKKDILIFEKIFVETMLSYEYSQDDIEQCLCLLPQYIPSNSPISDCQFDLTGNSTLSDDQIYSLCFDNTIPKYNNCIAYHKTFDESCCACQLCPYSAKYKNFLLYEEKLLLRFAFSSPENYNIVKKSGIKITHFKSVIDVVNICATAKAPLVYPLYKTLYKVLNAVADNYFQSQPLILSFNYKIISKIGTDIYNLHLPSECLQNSWVEKLIKAWESDFFNTPVCSIDDAQKYICILLDREKYVPIKLSSLKATPSSKKARVATKSIAGHIANDTFIDSETDNLTPGNLTISDFAETSAPAAINTNTGKNETGISEPYNTDSHFSGEKKDIIVEVEMHTSSNDMLSGNSSDADKLIPDTENIKYSQNSLNDANTLSTDYIDIVGHNDELYKSAVPAKSKVIKPYSTEPYQPEHLDMHGNLIYLPKVYEYELLSCSVSLDTKNVLILTRFENAVRSYKRMSVEIVETENGRRLFLIWVSSLHAFFHSALSEDLAAEIVLSLISQRSILKLTYSPYLLYSTIYHLGHGQNRNINSIQTMHYLVSASNLDFISCMRSYGITAATPGLNFKSKRMVTSEVFHYMPSYSIIYRKLYRHIDKQNRMMTYEEFSFVSEFLGASYDMYYYWGKKDFLFCMPRPLFIQFNSANMRLLTCTGYLITYDIEYSATPQQSVMFQILSQFASSGQLRNLSLQLIEYFEKKLVIFVREDDYEFFIDAMTRILFDVSEQFSFEILFHTNHLHIEKNDR